MNLPVHTEGEKYVTLEYAALHAHVPQGYLARLCRAGEIFFKEVKGEIMVAESSLHSFIAKRQHTLVPLFAPAETPDVAEHVARQQVLDDMHRLDADLLSASRTLLADAQSPASPEVSRSTEYTRQIIVLVAALAIYSGIYLLANANPRFAAASEQVHAMTASVADSISALFGTHTQ